MRFRDRDVALAGARGGLQGHNRGGAAVLTAVTRRFAEAVHAPSLAARAVLAAYSLT